MVWSPNTSVARQPDVNAAAPIASAQKGRRARSMRRSAAFALVATAAGASAASPSSSAFEAFDGFRAAARTRPWPSATSASGSPTSGIPWYMPSSSEIQHSASTGSSSRASSRALRAKSSNTGLNTASISRQSPPVTRGFLAIAAS